MVDGWITWLSDYLLPAAVITDDRIIITRPPEHRRSTRYLETIKRFGQQ